MRIVGIDIHRSFAQVAILEDGQFAKELQVDLAHDRIVRLRRRSLSKTVVIESTGNSAALERLLRPHDLPPILWTPDQAARRSALSGVI
jgi:hypothetical protein